MRDLCGFDVVLDDGKHFFRKHLIINPATFLGDDAFESVEIYKSLLLEICFEKTCIILCPKVLPSP